MSNAAMDSSRSFPTPTPPQPAACADTPRCVLVMDPLEETREVLRAALTRRGVNLLTARGADEASALARDHKVDVMVLDDEAEPVAQSDHADSPAVVFLGKVPVPQVPLTPPSTRPEAILAKPYHYAALIRTIEQMLSARQPQTPADPC